MQNLELTIGTALISSLHVTYSYKGILKDRWFQN